MHVPSDKLFYINYINTHYNLRGVYMSLFSAKSWKLFMSFTRQRICVHIWDLLVSDTSWYHHRDAQNHSPEHSLSPFLAGGMIFPPPSGLLDPCQSSSNNWKLISFNTTWLHPKLKKKKHFIVFFLSFPRKLVLIWTMPETWCYEHFLCQFASSRWIILCIPQL